MAKTRPRQPLPWAWVLSFAFLEIFFFIFQKIHWIKTDVFSVGYLLGVDVIPIGLLAAASLYSLRIGRERRLSRILLVIFGMIDLGTSVVSFFELLGHNRQYVLELLREQSLPMFMINTNLEEFFHEVFFLAIGLSFIKSQPFYLEYPKRNPFQLVLVRFIGVLFIGFAILHFVDDLLLLDAKMRGLI